MLAHRVVLVSLSALAACASTPEPALPPPPPRIEQARWILEGRPPPARAELALPGGRVLGVGDQGRRWVIDAAGAVTHAEHLAPVGLADVRAEGAGFVALGADGSLHVFDEPLGATRPRREKEHGLRFAFGAGSLLGVTEGGTLLRAAGLAAPWARAAPLDLRPGERVIDLATDQRGRVAVLLSPQRLLVSLDDGATFHPVPLVGIGAAGLSRDPAGVIWLRGRRANGADPGVAARLSADGRQLVLGSLEAPAPRSPVVRWLVAGGRVLRLETGLDGALHVGVGLPGAAPARAQLLARGPIERVEAVGHEGRLTLALLREDAVEIFESPADGAAFTCWDHRFRRPSEPFGDLLLAAGPGGLVLTAELCDGGDGSCAGRLRVGKDWRALETKYPPTLAAAGSDRLFYWEGPPGGWVVREISLDGGVSRGFAVNERVTALSVDPDGALAVLSGNKLQRFVAGALREERYLRFSPLALSLAGHRGLALTQDGAFETDDGGTRWIPVTVAGRDVPRCQAAGCSLGDALRVGWDLPARAPVESPPAPPLPAPPPPARKPAPEPLAVHIDCNLGRRWAPLPAVDSQDELLGAAGDARWLSVVRHPTNAAKNQAFLVRGGGAPATLDFLPRGASGRLHARSSDRGLLHAFFSFDPSATPGAYHPVDVQLGWLEAATGKVGKADLRGIPPFRVGSEESGALLALVEGGVVLLPRGQGQELLFVTPEGKLRSLGVPPPASVPYDDVVRAGGALLLSAGAHDLELALTRDDGKSWKTATWSVGTPSYLTAIGDAPAVLLHTNSGSDPLAVLPVGALAGDLPAWAPLPQAQILEACDPSARSGARWRSQLRAEAVTLHLAGADPATLEGRERYTRLEPGGKRCTALLVASTPRSDWVALVPPHDLAHGHVSRRTEKGGLEWTSLACKRG